MKHHSVDFLTQENRENLLRLAAYALSLPDDYEHFDMLSFGADPAPSYARLPASCGTAACLAGHSKAAGMREPVTALECEDWAEYSWNLYTSGESPGRSAIILPVMLTPRRAEMIYGNEPAYLSAVLWNWLFAGRWTSSDNTARGAAARIYYALEHGIPEDWHDQIDGYASLCYEPAQQEATETRRIETYA